MTDVNLEPQLDSEEAIDYLDLFRNLTVDSPNRSQLISLLMQSDAHYGHQKSSYNPLMSKYLYGVHGDIHVINLTKTIFLLKNALNMLVEKFSNSNPKLLFVGSKEQLMGIVKEAAERCGQYYVNHRWFGGTITNWSTIQKSIKKMHFIEKELEKINLHKKERQSYERVMAKLDNSLGGIKNMSGMPDMIFVTDTNREKVAIAEANKLGIPVIALLDSNSSPLGIDYPIPCNDDSQAAVGLVCGLLGDAVLTGMKVTLARRQSQQRDRDQNRRSYERTRTRRDVVNEDSFNNNRNDQENRYNGPRSERRDFNNNRSQERTFAVRGRSADGRATSPDRREKPSAIPNNEAVNTNNTNAQNKD